MILAEVMGYLINQVIFIIPLPYLLFVTHFHFCGYSRHVSPGCPFITFGIMQDFRIFKLYLFHSFSHCMLLIPCFLIIHMF